MRLERESGEGRQHRQRRSWGLGTTRFPQRGSEKIEGRSIISHARHLPQARGGGPGLRPSADPFLGLLRLLGAFTTGSWSCLGVDFGGLGGVLGPLGVSWVTWGLSWAVMRPSWVAVGVVLEPSGALVGPSGDPLEPCFGLLAGLLGHSRRCLGLCESALARV